MVVSHGFLIRLFSRESYVSQPPVSFLRHVGKVGTLTNEKLPNLLSKTFCSYFHLCRTVRGRSFWDALAVAKFPGVPWASCQSFLGFLTTPFKQK